MKVVRLSALRTGRLYHPKKYSRYKFVLEDESTPGSQCGRKNFVNDTIGNRTRDLPACRAVPKPTALQCAPNILLPHTKIKWWICCSLCGTRWAFIRSPHFVWTLRFRVLILQRLSRTFSQDMDTFCLNQCYSIWDAIVAYVHIIPAVLHNTDIFNRKKSIFCGFCVRTS